MTSTDSDRSRRIGTKPISPSRLTHIGRALVLVMVGLTITVGATGAAAASDAGHPSTSTPIADEEAPSGATVPTRPSGSAASSSSASSGAVATPTSTPTSTPPGSGSGGGGTVSESEFCGTRINQAANALISLSIYGGLAGMGVVYMGSSALESWGIVGTEAEEMMKKARRKSVGGGAKVTVGGSLLGILLKASDLPMASCIDLTPFF